MKPLLSFAHIICCAILLFGFVYYVLLMVFYFHQGSSITALDAMREDVKIWMERALAFELGSSLGSKEKDAAATAAIEHRVLRAIAFDDQILYPHPFQVVTAYYGINRGRSGVITDGGV